MKGLRCALALTLLSWVTLLGCGGASSAGPMTAAGSTAPADELTMNIPDTDWVRFDVPEGGVSLSVPGTPVRRVATREDSQTFEYLVAREPVAIVVAVERVGAVVVGDAESAGLDAVAELYQRRASESGRSCAPGVTETISAAGHQGRLLLATHCRDLSDGTLAAAAFMHGSMLIGIVVIGEGVGPRNIHGLLTRTLESIEPGPPPPWFQPVDTDVAIANVPGLSLRMPRGVVSEVVEQEGVVTARYTSEPIRGMAAIVSVTAPATLSAAEYCARVPAMGDLDLVDQRNHLGEPQGYCEVRGRVARRPELYQIHDIRSVGGAVVEMIWVGPLRPEFISGGDAQLAEIRASLTSP